MQRLMERCNEKAARYGLKLLLGGALCLACMGRASAQVDNSILVEEVPLTAERTEIEERMEVPANDAQVQVKGTTLHNLILGGKVAVTLPMKALNEKTWRQMDIGEPGNSETVYTRGLIVRIADINWLVIYKLADLSSQSLSPDRFRRAQLSGTNSLSGDTLLSMWLVRVDSLQHLDDIRPFDSRVLKTPLTGRELPNHYFWVLSTRYLQKLASALYSYREEYGYMPPMTNSGLVKKALLPYAENETIFTQPGTTQPYLPNPLLSGRMVAHLQKRMNLIAFYEAEPAADGKRAIMQLNGNVRRVDAATWRKLAKISELDGGRLAK